MIVPSGDQVSLLPLERIDVLAISGYSVFGVPNYLLKDLLLLSFSPFRSLRPCLLLVVGPSRRSRGPRCPLRFVHPQRLLCRVLGFLLCVVGVGGPRPGAFSTQRTETCDETYNHRVLSVEKGKFSEDLLSN